VQHHNLLLLSPKADIHLGLGLGYGSFFSIYIQLFIHLYGILGYFVFVWVISKCINEARNVNFLRNFHIW